MRKVFIGTLSAFVACSMAVTASPAQAATKYVKGLSVYAFPSFDSGGCSKGEAGADFTAPQPYSYRYTLKIVTPRGVIKKTAETYDYSVSISTGCVSSAFLKDALRKRLSGTISVYSDQGKYLGSATARVRYVSC
ncbi:hypothetical protein [Actinoplanes auranticolor]|uniref:Uncharacterized protein n=1 Tax=Actinoplanes auranticolor TaxID=47988 RepID=A0A919SL97_9ACTN|nr:hypothetical protein [Actinoplanes auranticolor]GIM73716.1 hypothetical protein Aau02nite_57320 [Actinoplanes auranticolor]